MAQITPTTDQTKVKLIKACPGWEHFPDGLENVTPKPKSGTLPSQSALSNLLNIAQLMPPFVLQDKFIKIAKGRNSNAHRPTNQDLVDILQQERQTLKFRLKQIPGALDNFPWDVELLKDAEPLVDSEYGVQMVPEADLPTEIFSELPYFEDFVTSLYDALDMRSSKPASFGGVLYLDGTKERLLKTTLHDFLRAIEKEEDVRHRILTEIKAPESLLKKMGSFFDDHIAQQRRARDLGDPYAKDMILTPRWSKTEVHVDISTQFILAQGRRLHPADQPLKLWLLFPPNTMAQQPSLFGKTKEMLLKHSRKCRFAFQCPGDLLTLPFGVPHAVFTLRSDAYIYAIDFYDLTTIWNVQVDRFAGRNYKVSGLIDNYRSCLNGPWRDSVASQILQRSSLDLIYYSSNDILRVIKMLVTDYEKHDEDGCVFCRVLLLSEEHVGRLQGEHLMQHMHAHLCGISPYDHCNEMIYQARFKDRKAVKVVLEPSTTENSGSKDDERLPAFVSGESDILGKRTKRRKLTTMQMILPCSYSAVGYNKE